MIRKVYEQIVSVFAADGAGEDEPTRRDEALRIATAVLMIDVARADHVFDETELRRVLQLIEDHFGLEPEQAAALVESADEVAADLVSVYEFTQRLHRHLDENEKATIVSLLWQVAYADGHLDKYENSLILKISDLLYVNRARVMRLKHDVAEAVSG